MYYLIKFQYRNNCRRSCPLFLSVSPPSLSLPPFTPISHKEVGEQSGESAPAEESKRSLYVSALSIVTRLLPVTAQQTTKKLCDTNQR